MSPSKDDNPAPAPKIAIKGFSISSKPSCSAKPKPALTSKLGKRPRSTFASHDSDSEGEGGGRGQGRVETVSGFEDGGAIRHHSNDEGNGKGGRGGRGNGPLVIPRMENRDWKGEARSRRGGGKNLLPAEVQAERRERERVQGRNGMEGSNGVGGKEEGVDVVNSKDGEVEWGLSLRKRDVVKEGEGEGSERDRMGGDTEVEQEKVKVEDKPKTADEEALAALLGTNKEKKGPDLVIASGSNANQQISETDAYRTAIASAPEASTLEDYERVPVEEFGAALLRGMGWKGESHGKVKDVKRRQNLLGLGARELKEAEELGAWVQKSDVKRLKPGGSGGSGGDRRGNGRVKVSEFKREEDRRREQREERGGGSYRRELERDRRDRDRERDRRR